MPTSPAATPDQPLLREITRLLHGGPPPVLPRHRHNVPREQVEMVQRARIIVGTANAVTELTYAKTVIQHIVERSGVSKKTFYVHFASKEDAFLAGFTLLDDLIIGLLKPQSTMNPRADLRLAVATFLEQLANWPLFTRMRFIEGRAAGPRADRARYALNDQLVAFCATAMEHARESDPLVIVPDSATIEILLTGINELATRHVFEHGVTTLPTLAPAIVAAVEHVAYGSPPTFESSSMGPATAARKDETKTFLDQ